MVSLAYLHTAAAGGTPDSGSHRRPRASGPSFPAPDSESGCHAWPVSVSFTATSGSSLSYGRSPRLSGERWSWRIQPSSVLPARSAARNWIRWRKSSVVHADRAHALKCTVAISHLAGFKLKSNRVEQNYRLQIENISMKSSLLCPWTNGWPKSSRNVSSGEFWPLTHANPSLLADLS